MDPLVGVFRALAFGDAVGTGASQAVYCTLEGVAKVNTPGQPFVVANEYLCARLGLMIGLPVPPGVIVRTPGGELAYVALRFGDHGQRPPPVIPDHVVEDNPHVAAGVIAFDCWVWNHDRHAENLAYVRGVLPLIVFDHSHALLGGGAPGDVLAELAARQTAPQVGGVLPPVLTSSAGLYAWAERIAGVSADAIRELCDGLADEGALTLDQARAVCLFLTGRKALIVSMLESVKQAFPKITDWTA